VGITAAKDSEAKEESQAEKKKAVVEYLQAPRKKRKSYIVLAFGENFDPDTAGTITKYVKTQFPKLSIATPKSLDEFTKQFNRQIQLVIADDHFIEQEPTLEILRRLKEKKHESATPVLFLTKDSESLIENYSKHLSMWHEVDDYIVLDQTSRPSLFQKIKNGVDGKNQRRSRRYKTSFAARYTLLDNEEKKLECEVVDISLHGALLRTLTPHVFSTKDQLVIHIPYGNYIKEDAADIIRIAARVRRVFINGDVAGLSWEHINETKLIQLTKLLRALVGSGVSKLANAARSKTIRMAKVQAKMPG
jgi:DNA-binding response OmpR family regulator